MRACGGLRPILPDLAEGVNRQGSPQILALANGDEKMRDATPAGLSLSEQLLKIHALTIKEQRNLLIGRHFRHPAFYSASNQNPVLAAP